MLLDLMTGDGLTLRRVASSNGGEHAGPCPRCGGRDRFRVWPKEGENGRFWCRGCGWSGDAIQYLRDYRGMSYPLACAEVGKEPEQKPNLAGEKNWEDSRPGLPSPQWRPNAVQPVPGGLWQEKARALVEWSTRKLWTRAGAEGQALLSAKGLTPETARRFRLGWIPRDLYRDRTGWGLEAKRRDDGRLKKLWLPAGLVIPCYAGPDLARVKFRPSKPMENGPKYLPLPAPEGQTVDTRPFIIGSGPVWIVVESELDGFLVRQEAGDLAGVVVMGSATYRPDQETANLLRKADLVLNALDSDRAGADSFWSWWRNQFTNSGRLPLPEGYGKDPSEAFQKGLDIRAWILAGFKLYGRLRPEALLSTIHLEDFEERAAIIEFDGGLARPEAERMALELVKGGCD